MNLLNKLYLRTLKKTPIEKDDDVFTIEEFIKMVQNGSIIDYDGHGKYSDGQNTYDLFVEPSQIKAGRIRPGFSHVVWYNR